MKIMSKEEKLMNCKVKDNKENLKLMSRATKIKAYIRSFDSFACLLWPRKLQFGIYSIAPIN